MCECWNERYTCCRRLRFFCGVVVVVVLVMAELATIGAVPQECSIAMLHRFMLAGMVVVVVAVVHYFLVMVMVVVVAILGVIILLTGFAIVFMIECPLMVGLCNNRMAATKGHALRRHRPIGSNIPDTTANRIATTATKCLVWFCY